MAQHIPIEAFEQKVFKKIHQAIKNDFKSIIRVKGSLKYELIDQDYTKDLVFMTDRYIGKGFMWGSNRGSFEIHYNKENRKINYIYLVG